MLNAFIFHWQSLCWCNVPVLLLILFRGVIYGRLWWFWPRSHWTKKKKWFFGFAALAEQNVPSTLGLVAHSDLDERAIEALKEFNEEAALQVLVQFKESDLSHVQVSLCSCFYKDSNVGVMRNEELKRQTILSTEQKCLFVWSHEDIQTAGEAGDQSFRF